MYCIWALVTEDGFEQELDASIREDNVAQTT